MDEFGEGNVEEQHASKKDFNLLLGLVIGALVVIGIAFITLVLNYFAGSQAAYNNLSNQVTAQNAKMDLLIQEYGTK